MMSAADELMVAMEAYVDARFEHLRMNAIPSEDPDVKTVRRRTLARSNEKRAELLSRLRIFHDGPPIKI